MPVKTELEPRYYIIKLSDLDTAGKADLGRVLDEHKIESREAVVIEADWPGYEQAKNIAAHGRVCKLGECCYCETVEARDKCFDWVKA